jgi:hypothetical protein
MHIVYLIKFKRNEFPNKYVGSKSNCVVSENRIFDRHNKVYMGSSKDKQFRTMISLGYEYELQVLGEFDNYEKALQAERDIHIALDVVANIEFFNKAIAAMSTFTNPAYAIYKHLISGKVARLPRNHPMVLSGEWVGITRGITLTAEERKKRGRAGKLNGFYGRKHNEETRKIIAKRIGDAHRGKPKSPEHRRKMVEAAKLRWTKDPKRKANREKESL